MSGSCHLDRLSNDKFSVECLVWFFQPTWKSDLKMSSFELMHPSTTFNVSQIVKLGAVKKDNNNKYLTFNTNFNIWRSVQMTWTRHYCWKKSQNVSFWNWMPESVYFPNVIYINRSLCVSANGVCVSLPSVITCLSTLHSWGKLEQIR